ncbi:MAG: hypothetical protein GYA36_19300 [Veillonellaceae bacterium]|nr:hypothetical protein [Veillonellaceae bacterium]
MRTQDEIVKKIRESESLFGFEKEVWLPFLDYEHAKPFLKPESTKEMWENVAAEDAVVLEQMRDYAAFGWEKIWDHRGISASRTIEKMKAWLWLLGTPEADELIKFADADENYPQYGAPILAKICRAYGFPIPDDAGIARMIEGKPCIDGCDEGCG